mmetsp:Transcript_24960/g.72014  ORF Transcript_24960/g.72014 Transcript_24960/m.72014 type:complete len:243 (+) Transcript_24960:30-758(+)
MCGKNTHPMDNRVPRGLAEDIGPNVDDGHHRDRESFKRPPGPRPPAEEELYRKFFAQHGDGLPHVPSVEWDWVRAAVMPARKAPMGDDCLMSRGGFGSSEGRDSIDDDDDEDVVDAHGLTSASTSMFGSTGQDHRSTARSGSSSDGEESEIQIQPAETNATARASMPHRASTLPLALRWASRSSIASSTVASTVSRSPSRPQRRPWRDNIASFGRSAKQATVAPSEECFLSNTPDDAGLDAA